MHLSMLVDMLDSGLADRVLVGSRDRSLTGAELASFARRGGGQLSAGNSPSAVVYAGENHALLPVALLAAAWAGLPFVPVNYRLDDGALNALIDRQPGALVLADEATASRLVGATEIGTWADTIADAPESDAASFEGDDVAVTIFTSGTTSEPKAAVLRNRHLMAYLLSTVEFGAAAPEDTALISVPPYHIAGVANLLSNLFAGRRIWYLSAFNPREWLKAVSRERVTNAMVVPTMLSRILSALETSAPEEVELGSLRSLSYGGAKASERLIRDALAALPHVDFVNAYGLTETASTIALLDPEDHRAAISSDDPVIQARLGSVGRVLPSIELELRDESGAVVGPNTTGMIYLRGEQIAGEYDGQPLLDSQGWFCTRDQGWVDRDGYLYVEGRADDTIIRGGENIAPAEIEEVLLRHDAVAEACVVGITDDEWGQQLAAAIVRRPGYQTSGEELQAFVRSVLRGSKTPERIVFVDTLPHTETGKILRRVVRADFESTLILGGVRD